MMEPVARPFPLRSALARGGALFLLWILLGRVGPADLVVGVVAAALATWLSLRLMPPRRRVSSLSGAVLFAAHFIRRSLSAGIDVARRVLDPKLPIAPGVARVTCRIPAGAGRQAFRACISLQPGTLPLADGTADMEMHLLDRTAPVAADFAADERLFLAAAGGAGAAHGGGRGV